MLKLILDALPAALRERVVEVPVLVETLDHLLLVLLVLFQVRIDLIDESVEVRVVSQGPARWDVNPARRALLAPHTQALLNTFATEPMQTLRGGQTNRSMGELGEAAWSSRVQKFQSRQQKKVHLHHNHRAVEDP